MDKGRLLEMLYKIDAVTTRPISTLAGIKENTYAKQYVAAVFVDAPAVGLVGLGLHSLGYNMNAIGEFVLNTVSAYSPDIAWRLSDVGRYIPESLGQNMAGAGALTIVYAGLLFALNFASSVAFRND